MTGRFPFLGKIVDKLKSLCKMKLETEKSIGGRLPLIEKEDIDRLKEIFVTRAECDREMGEVNEKLSNDMKELAVINTKLSLILWLLGAVGAAVITMLVKAFWGA